MATSPTTDLNREILGIVNQYFGNVSVVVNEVTRSVAREGAKMLREASPQSGRQRKTGKSPYAKGWKSTVQSLDWMRTTNIIHNDAKPKLAHLLEYGRKAGVGTVRKGRRRGCPYPYPSAPAIPHIAPVEEYIIAEVEKRLGERL